MKNASEKAVLVLASLVALVMVAFLAASMAADRRRTAALEQVRRPVAMDTYSRYAETSSPKQVESDGGEGEPREAAPRAERDDATDPDRTIAGYQRLFDGHDERVVHEPALEELTSWSGRLEELSPEDKIRFIELLEANQDFIAEIRRMAQAGGPVYPLDFSQGYMMELPHLAKLREFARILCRDAVMQAYGGNLDLAVENLVAGMQLGDALEGEPVLISQFVRIAIYGIVSDAMTNALPPGALPPNQVDLFVDHLAQADHRQALADSLSAESIMGLMAFERIRGGEFPGFDSMGPTDPGDTAERLFYRVYSSPIARPWFNNDEATYAEYMTEMADVATLPFHEAAPTFERLEEDIENLPITRVLSRVLLPALTRASQYQARHEATVDLMQMGLLLEQYYVDNGAYPDSLDPLASSLGGGLPVDPFTGESYVYQPSANSFLLYGVGINQTDDGGVHDVREGDLVWRGRESGE
jgi:hypothetical protein